MTIPGDTVEREIRRGRDYLRAAGIRTGLGMETAVVYSSLTPYGDNMVRTVTYISHYQDLVYSE